ncbi:30S ribosome-binding factor RbfA [Skermanella mucosa]|uniref:30S ribosome-binding factor RbfA n=1 Tax=Skermanella mucosa TaxID=1789672 RepID=UPI00192B2CA7|nr:30S ribosome-binding factor RbfA [Skermanella mucosa]UEM20965.1 30S ribosome-binding factor RbfA [Skermanella mucosa]
MSSKRAGRNPSQRQLRVGEELRHALAEVLRRGDFRDPDLQNLNVTVTEVRISPDLRNATAFITPLGGGHSDETVAALRRAAAFFRSQIARAVKLRYVPTLSFEADTSFEYADHINRLLHDPEVARDLDADGHDDDGDAEETHNGTHNGMNGDGPGHDEPDYEDEDDLDDEEDEEEAEFEDDLDEDDDDEEDDVEYEEDDEDEEEEEEADKPAPLKSSKSSPGGRGPRGA